MSDMCKCLSCGFEWVKGENGSNFCSTVISIKIRSLEADNVLLKNKVKELLKSHLETLNYYTEYLQVIPGVQEPDCTRLFQAKIDLIADISALATNRGKE